MRPKLPIIYLIGSSGGKVLRSLCKLEMNYFSSSRVIASFGLGTGFVGGGEDN